MKFFPYEHFEIQTSKPKNEIVSLLREKTNPNRPSILRSAGNHLFWGEVGEDRFKIVPIVSYRNSFVPVVSGTITEREDGAVVDVDMRLPQAVKVFSTVFLAFCAFTMLLSLGFAFAERNFGLHILIPGLMICFLYKLLNTPFYHEAQKARDALFCLLGGQREQIRGKTEGKKHRILTTVLTVLEICMTLFGFFGFMLSVSRSSVNVSKYYDQYPLNQKNGIAVDSSGNIYIGEGERDCIQVYDSKGSFQYGFRFPTGSGRFTFGIDGDQVHIVTARTHAYFVFDQGELSYSEKNIDENRSEQLQETYHMSDENQFTAGGNTYAIRSLNTVSVKDGATGQTEKIRLNAPLWPFSVFVFWFIAAMGLVPIVFRVIPML